MPSVFMPSVFMITSSSELFTFHVHAHFSLPVLVFATVGNVRNGIDRKDAALPCKGHISIAHLMYQYSLPSVVESFGQDTAQHCHLEIRAAVMTPRRPSSLSPSVIKTIKG